MHGRLSWELSVLLITDESLGASGVVFPASTTASRPKKSGRKKEPSEIHRIVSFFRPDFF
jgi:hypothetical protein